MKILLDECVPVQVRHALIGHDVSTVQAQGWKGIQNGELLAAAEAAGFALFILADKNLRYQQNLAGRRMAILELCLHIRLLDTKQIWKAGRQKRIVSYTFFPAFLPSKGSVLRRVSGNRISTELWTNHRPTLERHFPIMRAAAESIQMGEYHTLESP